MKNLKSIIIRILWVALLLYQFGSLQGQSLISIRGRIIDEQNQAVAYANIALYNRADSSFISGSISDQEGNFQLSQTKLGHFFISVSFVGFESVVKQLDLQTWLAVDLGTIRLREERLEIEEARISAERIKAKREVDRTTFYINSQMVKASGTAVDLIKYVPGVQVDLFHNISLEGKSNILILVNGMERDANFLSQLDPQGIDKVEIIDHPGAQYRSDISAVINIILKENDKRGTSGHVYGELPLTRKEVYAFPTASVNLSLNKVNLYVSYDGEFSHFDIEGINKKQFSISGFDTTITKTELKQQESWSHKFNAGMDYHINPRNQLSLYGFVNPWSNQFDGIVVLNETVDDLILNSRNAYGDEINRNRMVYGSIFYKHLFSKPGSQLSLDLNYYSFNGHSTVLYQEENGNTYDNLSDPRQKAISARLNVSIPLSERLMISAGVREMTQRMGDAYWTAFKYQELVSAAYTSMSFSGEHLQLRGGLRMEHAVSNRENSSSITTLLPDMSAKINLPNKKSLQFNYGKTVKRPTVYQLNPNKNRIDPYTTIQGNPSLKPATQHELSMDYSILVKNNYLSMGTFYTQENDCMEYLSSVSEVSHIQTTMQNLGSIDMLGVKILGSVKPVKHVSFNPFLRVYGVHTRGNELAKNNGIENRYQMALESGFSMSVLFKHNFSLNTLWKYNSAHTRIQGSSFDDMLYFLALEKTFKDVFMIGITSAIPFRKEFTYMGGETSGRGFKEKFEENIQMSVVPVWLKFKYSFSAGKKGKLIDRTGDFVESTKRKRMIQ